MVRGMLSDYQPGRNLPDPNSYPHNDRHDQGTGVYASAPREQGVGTNPPSSPPALDVDDLQFQQVGVSATVRVTVACKVEVKGKRSMAQMCIYLVSHFLVASRKMSLCSPP